jgi:minichromosome maintenance protein 10
LNNRCDSKLYSVMTLSSDRPSYNVPVEGDWVTIAIIAECREIKYTKPPVALYDDDEDTKGNAKIKGKGKAESAQDIEDLEDLRSCGKKFVSFNLLVDFGARSKSSTTGSKNIICGDALLSLLLFEVEGFGLVTYPDKKRQEKVYKSDSGGTFEALSKIKEWDVIVSLNSKILNCFLKSVRLSHPSLLALILAHGGSPVCCVLNLHRDWQTNHTPNQIS